MVHRRLSSPLHAARASVGAAFCLSLAAAGLVSRHPLVIATLLACIVVAGIGAGCGDVLRRAARFAVPLALLVALVNLFVTRNGLTVIARLGEVPPFGQLDLTLESLVYGGLDGVRVASFLLVAALFSAAVDPDGLLRVLGRISFRSALTGVLATRLVPVLARDARRLDDARRCRADGGGSGVAGRTAVLRAVTSGALDRAIDVAATLEVRGYGRTGRRAAGAGEPWSRHDVAFAVAAGVLLVATGLALALGLARFEAYPKLSAPVGPGEVALCTVLLVASLAPALDRRGIAR